MGKFLHPDEQADEGEAEWTNNSKIGLLALNSLKIGDEEAEQFKRREHFHII